MGLAREMPEGAAQGGYGSGRSAGSEGGLITRELVHLYVRQLRHPKAGMREEAARRLGEARWGSAEPPLRDLIRSLKDISPQVRACAADALGAIGDASAREFLLSAVEDESRLVRFRAAFALESLNPPAEIDERVGAWRRVVRRDPQNVYALCNLSMALRDLGDRESALETAYRAIELHPNHYYPYLLTGRLCAEGGDSDAAARYFECAVYCDPERPMPHYELGETYRLSGEYEQAARCYERVNELTGGRPESHFGLGFCYNRTGAFHEAAAAYEDCLRLHPEHYIAHNNLGLAHRRLGDLDMAARCFKRALELNPEYGAAQLNLGDTFLLMESAESRDEPPEDTEEDIEENGGKDGGNEESGGGGGSE